MNKRMPSVAFMSVVSVAFVCSSLGSAGAPANAKDQWQEPFNISLPERARTILLKPGADPAAVAEQMGLGEFRVLPRGRQGSMVETRLDDQAWQQLENTACIDPLIEGCETTGCQAIQLQPQLQGEATPGSDQGAGAVQARLVRNPPELVPVPDEADLEAGTCSGPPLIPPLAGPAGAGPGEIMLDLRGLPGNGGSGGVSPSGGTGAPAPATSIPGPATEPGTVALPRAETSATDAGGAASGSGPGGQPGPGDSVVADAEATDVPGSADDTGATDTAGSTEPAGTIEGVEPGQATASAVARRSFEFVLNSRFNPLGGVQLGTDELPDDTSDWSLVVGAGCSEVSVPLSSLSPARAPGMVLAVVVSGSAADIATSYNLQVVREITLDTTGETLAVFATADNIGQVIGLLGLDSRVTGAQPEYVYGTSAVAVGHSDPFAFFTYGPEKTGAIGLHGDAKGAGQLIAVIDTGVDAEHPELKDRIREHIDVSDRGWSADAHGTAVAGIIAANADNGLGSYGVAPEAEILALKACQPKEEGGLEARCWTSTLVKALDVAMVKDAGVINMSLAGPPDELLERYVGLATSQNRLVVAAAGNGGPNAKPGFPAALSEVLSGVVAVTAVDANDGLYADANLGDYIDVSAPGVEIIAPAPDGAYPPLSGTSMAAAHLSGIAALMRELMPMASGAEIATVLKTNVIDLGVAGSDAQFGAGLIDACAAAELLSAAAVVCPQGNLPVSASLSDPLPEPELDTGVSDELVIELD